MQVIQGHSSFINCHCLKQVAEHFKLPEGKEKIDVTPLLSYQSGLSSETITFKLEWTPNEKTLADIQSLLRKTFKSLFTHIHIVVARGGSLTVIC